MNKVRPFLWFDKQAEEAATFYVSIFANSRITSRSTMMVTFELDGREFIAFDGGPWHPFNDAISLFVDCKDQGEVDRYWDAFLSQGGEPIMCGWIKDKFGVRWQIVPDVLGDLLGAEDEAKADAVMKAMLQMVKLDIAALQSAYDGA